jgi:hypothetical protein
MKITKNLHHTQKCLIDNHMDTSVKYLYYSHAIIISHGNFHLYVLSPYCAFKILKKMKIFSGFPKNRVSDPSRTLLDRTDLVLTFPWM